MKLFTLISILLLLPCSISYAAPASTKQNPRKLYIATASNFLSTLQKVAERFEKKHHDKIVISSGSTGELYAQIINGAPFDLFLSADKLRPLKLEQQHLIVPNYRYTYALGQLVFWYPHHTLGQTNQNNPLKNLHAKNFIHVAIANPTIAPYGLAAKQVLDKLHQWQNFLPHIVYGENVNQTFMLLTTGNAEAGFVALSQIIALEKDRKIRVMPSVYRIPQDYYRPIKQQVVLLKKATTNPDAVKFYHFLHSRTIKELIENSGYKTSAAVPIG